LKAAPGVRGDVEGWIALTGTPGTGKSAAARALRSGWPFREVRDLALAAGAARPLRDGTVEVDLAALWRRFPEPPAPTAFLVGHLAHLLPVGSVVLLRCHPLEVERRLRRRRGLTAAQRYENLASEAIDVLLAEVRDAGLPFLQVDTTRRSPQGTARLIERWASGGMVPERPPPDWLADPRVSARLLQGPRRRAAGRGRSWSGAHPKVQKPTPP
jgi:adenylate kinase